MGPGRLELPTSSLSGMRSNRAELWALFALLYKGSPDFTRFRQRGAQQRNLRAAGDRKRDVVRYRSRTWIGFPWRATEMVREEAILRSRFGYPWSMTKRLIDVDDEKLEAVRTLLGTGTLKATVDVAFDEVLALDQRRRALLAESGVELAELADSDARQAAWG